MPKYSMNQAAAKRIAARLLGDALSGGTLPHLDSRAWRAALAAEGFSTRFSTSTVDSVIRELRNADRDAEANLLVRSSFTALFAEVMTLREAATDLVNAFGTLGKHRL